MGHGPWAFVLSGEGSKKTIGFVDGFNLYHAISDLSRDHLKWLDLRALLEHFAPTPQYQLIRVLYFSAHATWRKGAWARHRQYVSALEASGVEVVLAKFKKKHRACRTCGSSWVTHEEKETDVSIGAHLVDLACL